MSKHPKPYIRCERRNGEFLITAMRSTGTQLVLGGRVTVPVGDPLALASAVETLITDIRASEQKVGKQANGNS